MCIVSLWDTLVVSAPADAADLRDRIRDLTRQFSRCLVGVVSPQVSLHRRLTFPDWISPTLLSGWEAEQSEAGDDPPQSAKESSSAQRSCKVSQGLPRGVSNKESEEIKPSVKSQKGCGQENYLRSAHEVTPGHSDTTDSFQLSSPKTPPRQSICGSFLASRRLGTATDPREPLPPRRASIIARRRLSLAAPQAASQLPPAPQQVQRRLFPDNGSSDVFGVAVSSPSTLSRVLPSSRSRKRLNPGKSVRRPEPNLADFEDSTQFVLIPPSNCASKRMRLTEHQKERRREQRQAYLPAMYNNLDVSNVSASSNMFSSISSSSSQLLKGPARFKAPTPSVGASEPLTFAESQPSPFSPKATNATTSTSSGGTASAFETTRGPQKESPMKATDISTSDKTTVDGALPGTAFEEEAPICLELEGPEGVSEGDAEEEEEDTGAEVSIIVDTEPLQHKATPTEDALAASEWQTALASSPPSMLSASPVVFRPSSAVLRSPLIGSPAGLRAQRILEMGLAKAAKGGKQRILLPGSRTNSQLSSPITSVAKPSDSPSSRPGILRDITTPRPKTRVSFVEQPTVFILGPSESSPNALWLKEIDSSTSKAFPVVPSSPPTSITSDVTVVADSQNPQQNEVACPPVNTTPLLYDRASRYPDDSKSIEVRQAESYSPPSLSSSVGDRRRKSTPPRRYAPINRASRGPMRSSLGGSGSAGARLHLLTRSRLFTESEDCGSSSRVTLTSATAEGTEVDLDALTSIHSSPLRVVVSKTPQHSPLVVEMVTTTQSEDLTESAIDKEDGLASEPKSTIQVVSSDIAIEKGINNEDVVEGSQESDDAEVIVVSDTEAEQIGGQPERNNGGTETQHESVDTTLADAAIGATMENVAQDDATEQARQTIGNLRDQLLLIPSEQQKGLLLEVLALFKNVIP
ncbi:Telomere-associated protein RIF1 [Taenia solium]|eukprot:TsM_001099800 transcript=TsM_001099800 gene=TsM_001099800